MKTLIGAIQTFYKVIVYEYWLGLKWWIKDNGIDFIAAQVVAVAFILITSIGMIMERLNG